MSELQWTKKHQNGLFSSFVSNKVSNKPDGFYGSITEWQHGKCAWRVVENDDNDEYLIAVGEADSLEAAKKAVADFIAKQMVEVGR